jgi:signal transduction histidine kinase
MNDEELRDHARQMLMVCAADIDMPQSEHERSAKSRGLGQRDGDDTAAEVHAEARLLSGYTVVQLVSEYRALRSSVLSLWSQVPGADYATSMIDMTRFNEAIDQALAESVARYERLVKQSQNMFLAILGHDLRNPLGALVTGSSFIMQATDVPPKYLLAATRMFGSARRMSKLIDDLIDFTRTHLGARIPIQAEQGDLVEVCEQVVNELRTARAGRAIELHDPRRLDARFDAARMAQMLSNLIGNALQYGSTDTPVVVDVSGSATQLTITVHNRGPVIPPDKLSSIFDPMVRLASSGIEQADSTSLGIGLFISREIAQAHGGDIAVASGVGDGTTFTVTLPRRIDNAVTEGTG